MLVHHGLFWSFNARRPDAACWPSGCGRCSSTTSRSPPTTCRSTRIPRSATTPCWPTALGASGHVRVRGRSGAAPTFAEPVPRRRAVRARGGGHRPRAARLRRRPAARCGGSRSSPGGAASRLDAGGRGGLRRVPHRRAEGERDGRRARGRDPLHRRRPLRDGDVRRRAGWATGWPTASASSTSGWTSRIRCDGR